MAFRDRQVAAKSWNLAGAKIGQQFFRKLNRAVFLLTIFDQCGE